MKKFLLPENGQFYKANMHCHSSYSDGKLSPQELKRIYKEKGYSVLAITDHDGLFEHSYLDDPDFLTIPAYEKEIDGPENPDIGWDSVVTCHVCIYPRDRKNLKMSCFDPDFFHPRFRWMQNPQLKERIEYVGEPYKAEYTVESINHIIEQANKSGFIVTLNHLQWSQEPYEQFIKYKGMFATEIYNTSCEKALGNDEHNGAIYDMLLKAGNKIKCVATDDNHNSYPLDDPKSDSFGGYIMIKAPDLSYDNIFSAFENGSFYSSTGPQINELFIEDGWIKIKTSDAKKIRLISSNRHACVKIAKDGEYISEASFDLKKIDKYFRIEVTDEIGEKAYTNAYFKEDILSE